MTITADVDVDVVAERSGEPLESLLRRLRTTVGGLSSREASRRLLRYGRNELPRAEGPAWWADLAAQCIHPLALVLWVAALLAWISGTQTIALAIVLVIALNAVFAFVQERHAQHAAEALNALLPRAAVVIRDRTTQQIPAVELVPGDLLVVEEGDRICADGRLVEGEVDVDMSPLTGESMPVSRSAEQPPGGSPLTDPNHVFSGTLCTEGAARVVVTATGAHTELGRIAALSRRVTRERSPLEKQVRRVAWLIAVVGAAVGAAFMPLGLLAGLPASDAFLFAIGLLVANVPEGLLPTITLALAAGVRSLARRGAVVKRLSAVETLGSTTVICTDKTGTLTQNHMRAIAVWTPAHGRSDADAVRDYGRELAVTIGEASTVVDRAGGPASPDPTELALFALARDLGVDVAPGARDARRLRIFRFSSERRRMSVVSSSPDGLSIAVKGAPEAVVPRCARWRTADGDQPLDRVGRAAADGAAAEMAADGLRVLAVARRMSDIEPASGDDAERDLTLLGYVGLLDPPRLEVAAAIRSCHRAGIRIHVVTGDNGATAAHIAREVGLGDDGLRVVRGDEVEAMSEDELEGLLSGSHEIVFARTSPETKLRIADALRGLGHVVAMTGDGVNDAPALHRADIGVAMGRSGTDVAREAATVVLTDDNFATIAAAVEEGRRVYDNVRKFILYIFAHATPEVVPFLVFALAGGLVPLPLTVVQILAIDLGTETLPALALGRERAEPGVMDRPPRPPTEPVVRRALLIRAWLLLGGVSAVLVTAVFFLTLLWGGWHPGDPVGSGSPLHRTYLQATTATFVGIVACQIGTAFAARTTRASLRAVGITTNHMLLAGLVFELAFTAALVLTPHLSGDLGMVAPPLQTFACIAAFPIVVWGADELVRWHHRRSAAG